jgi:phytoene dehydrogenase-like protein
MDWALSSAIPWRNKKCLQAATVHVGGTFEEISASERKTQTSIHSQHPFVLLSQPTLFDPSRAPHNHHVAWAYCHVPTGNTESLETLIENQIERFAPGFKKVILARHQMTSNDFEIHNPNLVGGDINGGLNRLDQMIFRPLRRLSPYQTSSENIFICSSSTPPGSGVHGMCGYLAANSLLKKLNK